MVYFRNYSNEYSFITYFDKRKEMSFIKYWSDAGYYEDDYAIYGTMCDEVIDLFFEKEHNAKLYYNKDNKSAVIILDDIFTVTNDTYNITTDYVIGIELFFNTYIENNIIEHNLEFLESISDLSMERLTEIYVD